MWNTHGITRCHGLSENRWSWKDPIYQRLILYRLKTSWNTEFQLLCQRLLWRTSIIEQQAQPICIYWCSRACRLFIEHWWSTGWRCALFDVVSLSPNSILGPYKFIRQSFHRVQQAHRFQDGFDKALQFRKMDKVSDKCYRAVQSTTCFVSAEFLHHRTLHTPKRPYARDQPHYQLQASQS